jgi:hypothetical protein
MDEAAQLGQQLGGETVMQMYGVGQLALARSRGGMELILPIVASMVEEFPLIPAWRCGLAYVYRELSMLDEARGQLEILAADDFRSIPRDANWPVGMAVVASVCNALDDRVRAAVAYEMLLPHAESMVVAGLPAEVLSSAHGPLTILAATLGRWDDAEAHHAADEVANLRMGNRMWVITGRWEWGRLIAQRGWDGDAERARGILEACAAEAREVGMTRTETLATDLLATLA